MEKYKKTRMSIRPLMNDDDKCKKKINRFRVSRLGRLWNIDDKNNGIV